MKLVQRRHIMHGSQEDASRPRSARHDLEIDVDLSSESHFFTGLSGDIAAGGIFYVTYRELAVGTRVVIDLSLAGMSPPLVVSGTVRWVREHSPEQPRGVGIALDVLSLDAQESIRAFLQLRPPLYYDDVGSDDVG